MSRAATATPPPAYFPQRNATPTMRHCSSPNISAVHFASHHGHKPHHPKKKFRTVSSAAVSALSPKSKVVEIDGRDGQDSLGLSFEEISSVPFSSPSSTDLISRSNSQTSVSSAFRKSNRVSTKDIDGDEDMERHTPAPSMTASSDSFVSTNLPTPASSRSSSLLPSDAAQLHGEREPTSKSAAQAARPSWVPYFGKMAKAVVNTGLNMSIPFADKKKKDAVTSPVAQVSTVPAAQPAEPAVSTSDPAPQPSQAELAQLSEEEAMALKRHWAYEQQRRVTECARLCSQWPHSGYNQSKWGPNGSRNFYEPQSYANPQYVASLMARQADLERNLHERSALFFTSRRSRAGSENTDDDSEPSLESYESSHPSPSASFSLCADISAAMASPLIPSRDLPKDNEMDDLTSSTATLDSSAMDIDQDLGLDVAPPTTRAKAAHEEQHAAHDVAQLALKPPSVRPTRAQSCGSKRPYQTVCNEEDKRRKVDEALVVSEAVDNGVIQPSKVLSPGGLGTKHMSSSVPDLSTTKVDPNPAVFGHFVKTSDTHPIIISPFFPPELIPTIAEQIVVPASGLDTSPLQLSSKIDVPSLLLSYTPPLNPSTGVVVPSPSQSDFEGMDGSMMGVKLGNLLLSSCPGKRLRMEGPVKGRGPVCRDLATDLKRIKSEGVGCLVCCLDDPELALLGVPWETYRQVANDIGLDVIRLPMPDGFTPVSLSLFDNQVSLIVRDYSLKGINVLVHCRGGVGRAGLTASAWAIKMGFVPPHPSLSLIEEAANRQAHEKAQQDQAGQAHTGGLPGPHDQAPQAQVNPEIPAELEHQIVMSIVERVIAMIRSRRGLKAIESFEQVQFLASYVKWSRATSRSVSSK